MAPTFSGFRKKAKRNSLKNDYAKESRITSLQQQDLYYDSCSLPLWNFIQVITSGELHSLVISGNPTPEQLLTAWNDIFTEYCDSYRSKEQTYVLQLTREIKHIDLQINVMQICVNRLTVSYFEDAANILKEYGFNYPYTPETMLEDLTNTVAEAQYLVVQKGVKEGEYKRYLEANKGNGEEAKESDYDDILTELSRFQGYRLQSKDLSVREYVSIFNRYKKENGGKTVD